MKNVWAPFTFFFDIFTLFCKIFQKIKVVNFSDNIEQMIRVDELSVETLLEKTWFFEMFTYGVIAYEIKHIMVPLVKDKGNEGQESCCSLIFFSVYSYVTPQWENIKGPLSCR